MFQDQVITESRHREAPAKERHRAFTPILARSPEGVVFGRLEAPRAGINDRAVLRRAMEDAEARSARAAYLMAAAGHDLRQPLQVIALALDRIAPGLTDAGQLDWLDVARGEVSNLSEGLTELAVAARLAEPQTHLVRLDDLLTDATVGWRHHAAARGLRLRVVARPWTVRSDRRLLSTIVRNLVGNAVHNTRSGGVLVACRRRSDGFRVDVIDTGPGLPEGEVAELFEAHRSGRPGGLGLGLTLVRDAAERLGCHITICSIAGRGSRFSITIPR